MTMSAPSSMSCSTSRSASRTLDGSTCCVVGYGGAHQLVDARVVRNLSADDDSAVSVIGVLAQADVGHDEHLRQFLLARTDGRLDRGLPVGGQRTDVVFGVGNAEQQ